VKEVVHPVGTLVWFRETVDRIVHAVVIKSELDWRGCSDHDIFIPSSNRISYGWDGRELFEVKES